MKFPNEKVQTFSKPNWLKRLTRGMIQKFVEILFLFCSCTVFATPLFFQNSDDLSSKNIDMSIEWFSSTPHPMGSRQQKKVQKELLQTLRQLGLKTQTQRFFAQTPNIEAKKWGGLEDGVPLTQKREGVNILGTRASSGNCALILAGHYDTKYFREFEFMGANDGGSSTALLLELARVIGQKKFPRHSLGNCHVTFAFFDGEESFLPEWSMGESFLQMRDNTYGSRAFAQDLMRKKGDAFLFQGRPLQLVMVFDMVGHKNQKLFLTDGSDPLFRKSFLASLVSGVEASASPVFIDDDHVPFLKRGVPVVHMIDWNNLQEWHTNKDTKEIISSEKIKKLGESILNFMAQTN